MLKRKAPEPASDAVGHTVRGPGHDETRAVAYTEREAAAELIRVVARNAGERARRKRARE